MMERTMAKKSPIHTVPNASGSGWVNKQGGEVISRHIRKDTAEAAGRKAAKEQKAEHVIHKRDGTIGEKNSHGGDPFPPRG